MFRRLVQATTVMEFSESFKNMSIQLELISTTLKIRAQSSKTCLENQSRLQQ
jgi:hypothetical protein